jgi:nucleoside-diphosphate-sugar epimerase
VRVLLTGHQGYLGTVAAPLLAAAGHDVVGLDSGLFADCVLGSLDVPDVRGWTPTCAT